MKNWKRILAAVGTAALLASNVGAASQVVFADDTDISKEVPQENSGEESTEEEEVVNEPELLVDDESKKEVATEKEEEPETESEEKVEEPEKGTEGEKESEEETNEPEVTEEEEAEVIKENVETPGETTGSGTKTEEKAEEKDTVELEYQELEAEIYTDSSKTTLSQDEATVTLSGDLPVDATIEAYPIDLEIEGQVVLAAYDITIWVDGTEYEPDEQHPVSVKFDIPSLKDVDTVNVYHVEDDKENPDLVHENVTVEGEAAEFEAVGFSGYAATTPEVISAEPMLVANAEYTVQVGSAVTITGTTNEGSGRNYSDSWSSSNSSIASVSKNSSYYGNSSSATVTGKAAGTVTITHTYYVQSGWGYWTYYSKQTETFTVTVTAKQEANEKALVYALKSPTGTPGSNDTNEWTSNHNWQATVNVTGGVWEDNGSYKSKNIVDNTPSYIVSWPDGSTGSSWKLTKGDSKFTTLLNEIWGNYQSEVQKDLGVSVSKDNVKSITLTPYKISRDNGTTPDYHVDCTISIECDGVYTAKFWVKEVGKTGYENYYSKNYKSTDSVDGWTYTDTSGRSYAIGSIKEVNGTKYKLVGWYVEDETGSQPSSTIADWKYTPTSTQLEDGAVNFYAEWVEAKGDITIFKYGNGDQTNLLNGAMFELRNSSGTLVDTKVTSNGGKLTFEDLPYDTYTVTETNAPDGYQLGKTTSWTITVDSDSTEQWIDNDPIKTPINLKKIDGKSSTPLANAEFTLTKGETVIDTVKTDANGAATFSAVVDGEYTIQEKTAPDKYQKIDGNVATVTIKNGQVTFSDLNSAEDVSGTLTVENTKNTGKLTVSKKITGTDEFVDKDEKFSIKIHISTGQNQKYGEYQFDSNGDYTAELVNNGSITIEGIDADSSYTVTETTDSRFTVSYVDPDTGKTVTGTGTIAADTESKVQVQNNIQIVKTGVSLGGNGFQRAVVVADVMVGMFLLYGFVKRRLV